jgi:hypothetical protein
VDSQDLELNTGARFYEKSCDLALPDSNFCFHCCCLRNPKEMHCKFERDAISVQKAIVHSHPPVTLPWRPDSQQTPIVHSSITINQMDSIASKKRTSVCFRSFSAPSGITAFHPDHSGILIAFINSLMHSHFRWRRHLCVAARQSLHTCSVHFSIIRISHVTLWLQFRSVV